MSSKGAERIMRSPMVRNGMHPVNWLLKLVEKHPALLFVSPAIVVLLALNIFPFIWSLRLSFFRWNLSSRAASWVPVGLGNYINILTKDPFFWPAAKVTVTFVAITVVSEFLLGLFVSLLLYREKSTGLIRTITRTVVVLPMMLTPVVVGLIWRFMYNPDLGMVNYFLSLVGIRGPIWLGDVRTGLLSVMIADIWQWTSFMVVVLLAALEALPYEPLEAALVDGASRFQMLRYIVIPMLRPAILVALLVRTIDSFKTFDLVYVLTMGGPGVSTQVLSLYTYKWGFKFFEMGYAAALSYVMLIAVDTLGTLGLWLTGLSTTRR